MKRIIRQSVFETNSSSTHSLSIVTEEQFDIWSNNPNMYFIENVETFITREDAIKMIEKQQKRTFEDIYIKYKEYYADDYKNTYREFDTEREFVESKIFCENGMYTYEEWCENESFGETFKRSYISKNGDKIAVFGYYNEEH